MNAGIIGPRGRRNRQQRERTQRTSSEPRTLYVRLHGGEVEMGGKPNAANQLPGNSLAAALSAVPRPYLHYRRH
jgi:hypothetical protein